MKRTTILLLLMVPTVLFSKPVVSLTSPDQNIQFTLELGENAPEYSITFKGKPLLERSTIALEFQNDVHFRGNLVAGEPVFRDVETTYDLVVGKASHVHNYYREVIIPLMDEGNPHWQVDMVVRAFNDGVAFRYVFKQTGTGDSFVLTDEQTSFKFAEDPLVRALHWDQFENNHEGFYETSRMRDLPRAVYLDVPALFIISDDLYVAITEASLRDYAGMYLTPSGDALETQLTPLPDQSEVKVIANLPHQSPWRVIMIADRIGGLIESNILTSLNEPSAIEDTSWIQPGKTTFHWWNGDIIPDTDFAPGINFKTSQYYIDFCARNNIQYHAVIGYGGIAWYQNNWSSYSRPGTYADVTKPVPSLDMQAVCDYAESKGVGIHVWVHWQALYPQLEEAFAQFEKWGIKGLMVDFLDRSDQQMVNIQEEILQAAARHRLYIQFHGAYKPTGLHRTYPNELTREGALNYEYNKWRSEPVPPEHDLNIVFTRMLAGPTDYHLGGFRAVPPSEFKTQYTRPLMSGTRCHMLAMYVVLESYLSMVADYPEAYENEPGFTFLTTVPSTWDETRVPAAQLDAFVSIARRKQDTWYLGTINSSEARTISIPLDFLSDGFYDAHVYADAEDSADFPNHLTESHQQVRSSDTLDVWLAPGGGQVVILKPRVGE